MINGIDYEKFRTEFLETDIGKQILADFDTVTCQQKNFLAILFVKEKFNVTVRELLGRKDLVLPPDSKTTISIISLYYLQFLLEKNPSKIYDIGCGWNMWKRYYPNIIGIDYNNKFADINEKYDTAFVERNKRKLESAMCVSMNAAGLQNGLSTFDNIVDQIYEFSTMIVPGGRGYVAQSCLGLYRFTPLEWYKDNNCTETTVGDVLKERLLKLPLKIISLDCEFDIFRNFAGNDGELRVVFEVPEDVEV